LYQRERLIPELLVFVSRILFVLVAYLFLGGVMEIRTRVRRLITAKDKSNG
jgi:hypothetical protein